MAFRFGYPSGMNSGDECGSFVGNAHLTGLWLAELLVMRSKVLAFGRSGFGLQQYGVALAQIRKLRSMMMQIYAVGGSYCDYGRRCC